MYGARGSLWVLVSTLIKTLPLLLQVKARLQKMGALTSMNIFLRQEVDRMQRVITMVRNTLVDLKLAIDGTIIMSENLKDALDNIYDARVPGLWRKVIRYLYMYVSISSYCTSKDLAQQSVSSSTSGRLSLARKKTTKGIYDSRFSSSN